ncbi:unnamed protein product, partial [Pleuronectes platessa]
MATGNRFSRVTLDHLLHNDQHYPGGCDVATIKGGSSISAEINILIKNLQKDLHYMEVKYEEEKAEKEVLKTLLHNLITGSLNGPCSRVDFDQEKLLHKQIQDLKEQLKLEISGNDEKISEYKQKISKDKQTLSGYKQKISEDTQKISDYEKKIQELKEQLLMEQRKSAASAEKIKDMEMEHQNYIFNVEQFINTRRFNDWKPIGLKEVHPFNGNMPQKIFGYEQKIVQDKDHGSTLSDHKPKVSNHEIEDSESTESWEDDSASCDLNPDVSDDEPELPVDEPEGTDSCDEDSKSLDLKAEVSDDEGPETQDTSDTDFEISDIESDVSDDESDDEVEEPEVEVEEPEVEVEEPEVEVEEPEVEVEEKPETKKKKKGWKKFLHLLKPW